MRIQSSLKLLIGFILILILTLLSSNFIEVFSRITYTYEHSSLLKLSFYFMLFLLSVGSLLILTLIKNRIVYILFLIIGFITLMIQQIFVAMGHNFNENDADLMIREYAYAGDAFLTFIAIFAKVLILTIFMLSIYHLIRVKINIRFSNKYLILVLLSFLTVVGITYKTKGFYYFPSHFNVPSNFIYSYNHQIYSGKKDKPLISPKVSAKFDNILFIVDESVRADMLSLNGYGKKTTPFLDNLNNLYNYGYAITTANCSAQAQIMLQHGTRPQDLPSRDNTLTKKANIFQYAKTAGFTTHFLDNQNITQGPVNFMSKSDFKHIDHEYKLHNMYTEKKDEHLIDFKSIDVIVDRLTQGDKNFIYLEKLGNHFIYENKSPQSHKKFLPSMTDITDYDNKEAILNSYLNAITWQVDEFFNQLVEKLKDKNVLIVYVSDHGQNFNTNDTLDGVLRTHCNLEDPSIYEALVPFFVIPVGDKYQKEYKTLVSSSYKENFNHVSSFNLFPTLLVLMGYDQKEVNTHFEKTIFDDLSDQKRVFFSGNLWNEIFFRSNNAPSEFEKIR